MLIKTPDLIKPSEITDKQLYLNRRKFISNGAKFGMAGALFNAVSVTDALAGTTLSTVKNDEFSTQEVLTPYDAVTSYNNFYEFGTHKSDPSKNSGKFKPQPWSVAVDGECMKPGTYTYEDIVQPHQLEERIYRLRCVEAWSMVIPWVGIPLADVLKRFEPTSQAKYVAFTTIMRPEEMPGLKRRVLDWPYREGLRIDEAMHPLTLLTVGLYGEVLPNQNGAPMRLIVPWKYGFKSVKSIVRIEFTSNRPDTSWNMSAPQEYGFYSNVNPEVDHPRWSQRKERRIGDFFKSDTLMFNGYGEQVAALYSGMDLRKNY